MLAKIGVITQADEGVKTILNTGRPNGLAARIPSRMLDFTPATAPGEDLRTAQPVPALRRKSALSRDREGAVLAREQLAPGPSPLPWQRAAWRLNCRLHNKERARYVNPLTSAKPLFSPRGEAKCVRGPSVGGERREVARTSWRPRRPPGRRRLDTVRRARRASATKSWRSYRVLRPVRR